MTAPEDREILLPTFRLQDSKSLALPLFFHQWHWSVVVAAH